MPFSYDEIEAMMGQAQSYEGLIDTQAATLPGMGTDNRKDS